MIRKTGFCHRAAVGITLVTVAIMLLTLCEANADQVSDWIVRLQSGDRETRIEAVMQLGELNDQRAADALVPLLDLQIDDIEEREQLWFHLARALHRLASFLLGDDRILPALERLSTIEPTITYLDTENFRTPRKLLKYPFHGAARNAANFIKVKKSETTLKREMTGMNEQERLAYLIDEAWKYREGEHNYLYIPAREELKKLDTLGIEPTMAIIGSEGEESQLAALEYFEDIYQQTKDQRGVQAILELTESKYPIVWQRALFKLKEIKDLDSVNALITKIETNGTLDHLFTTLAIETIVQISAEVALPFLSELLSQGETKIALSAADALATVGEPAVPVLLQGIKSEKREIRLASANALLKIKTESSKDALKAFLDNYPDEDQDLIERIKNALEE